MLRLSTLDTDAATAVRVIAHFEALLSAPIDAPTLVRSTAGLAECAAGLELADGRLVRFGPDGVALPGAPRRVSGTVALAPAGRVWLERPGEEGPFDELVLEWMAITARVLGGPAPRTRPPHVADPALVELVLSEREAVEDRARALRLLGLSPELPLRVLAVGGRRSDGGVAAVALLGRGSLPGTVRVASVGPLGAVLVQRTDGTGSPAEELRALIGERNRVRAREHGHKVRRGSGVRRGGAPDRDRLAESAPGRPAEGAPGRAAGPAVQAQPRKPLPEPGRAPGRGVRVGIGGSTGALAAAASWRQARAALRFAAAGIPGGDTTGAPAGASAGAVVDAVAEAVVDHDALGPVALLAEIPVERLRAEPDVRALEELAGSEGGGASVAALAAFCRTGSLRQAAAALHLHHSSVAARLAQVEAALGYRLREPSDRFRAQLALYARRLAAME